MKKHIFCVKMIFTAFLLFKASTNSGYAASFNCADAYSETEKAICGDPYVEALDELMGILWLQNSVNHSAKQDQKSWLALRDECLSDMSCLKNIYLDRLTDDLFELDNFRVTKLFNFQAQNENYYLVRDEFGGAYNMEMYVSRISPSKLEKISWKLPEFDEQEKTCGLSILISDATKVSDAESAHGWIDLLEQEGYADRYVTYGEVSVFRKWVGHGDLSDEIVYRLYGNQFIPVRGLLDNCADQKQEHIPVYFE